jgi:site-specific DNA-methyltransferase (adenine-specific)
MLETNKIYLGDCLEVMKQIDDKSVDLILCDLPYGVSKMKWDSVIPFDELWTEYKRIRKDGAPIVLFGTEPFTSAMIMSNVKEFKQKLIWNKVNPVGHLVAKYKHMQVTEDVVVFGQNKITYNPQMSASEDIRKRSYKPIYNNYLQNIDKRSCTTERSDRFPTNLIKFSNANRRGKIHPTEKPVDLLEYLIKTYSNEGSLILDNCCGSGSTLKAAQNLNRNFIGIEQNEFYFNIANLRLNDEPYLHLKSKTI